MTSDLKKINRELLKDFIRAYENQPCLWRVKSKCYYDKAKKDAAYDLLLVKYNLLDPTADREAVVKKINSFRTNYRREKKKIEESRKTGEVYKPKLWYFNLFKFLDQETSKCLDLPQKEDDEEDEPSVEELEKSLLKTMEKHFNQPKIYEERHELFGRSVGLKMRDISDDTQRLLAEKLINDALFMAEMGQLRMSHMITTNIRDTRD